MSSMGGPGWVPDLFAAAMLLVAAYSVGHLVLSRWWGRRTHVDIDIMHLVMGVAMAGMLVEDLNPIRAGVWEVVFSVMAVVFAWRCYRFVVDRGSTARDEDRVHHLSHYATHLVMALAMLYMYLAVPTTGTTTDFVGLPLLFLLILIVSGVWELDGSGRLACVPTGPPMAVAVASAEGGSTATVVQSAGWLTPRLESGAHVVMCVTMAYMLILML